MEVQALAKTQHRLAQYYLDKLRSAEAAYQHGHEHSEYALSRFDHEWPQIRYWADWAATYSGDDHNVSSLGVAYGQAAEEIFRLRLSPTQWLNWLKSGLSRARDAKDTSAQIRHLYLIATAYNDAGELDAAETNALKALELAKSGTNLSSVGHSLKLLGNIKRLTGDYDLARSYFEQSSQAFLDLGDLRQVGKALLGLGLTAWMIADFVGAKTLFTEALAVAREAGQELDVCDALIDLSLPTHVLGDPQTARELVEECRTRCRTIGYHLTLAASTNTLGAFERAEGNMEEALELFKDAIAIARKSGVTWDLPSYLVNASGALMHMGQLTEALEYCEEALELTLATGRRAGTVYNYSTMAQIYLELGEIGRANGFFRDALALALELDNSIIKLHQLFFIMRGWRTLGKFELVVEYAGLLLSLPFCMSEEQSKIQELCAGLEDELGPTVYSAALERGRLRTLDETLRQLILELENS